MNISRPQRRRILTINLAFLFCWIVFLLYAGDSFCHAQGMKPKRGINPGTSYALSDIESINTTNGNLGFRIPVASLPPGPGGFSGGGISLIYNSKIWDTPTVLAPDGTYDNHGQPNGKPQNFLKLSTDGGWRYGAGYEVRLVNRLDDYSSSPLKPTCEKQSGTSGHEADYIYKVQVIFPDGSAHEFAPQGYQTASNTTGDGYYNIRPDGYLISCQCTPLVQYPWVSCTSPITLVNAGTITYYSTDGTYIRLDVAHDSDNNQWNNAWTMYLPDGTRVVGSGFTGIGGGMPLGSPGSERVYDRNNNYVDIQITNSLISLTDQFNRSVSVQRNASPGVDYVNATGYGGTPLTWTVRWKFVFAKKTYSSADPVSGCPQGTCMSGLNWGLNVVDRIELPTQSGGLAYSFGYNGASDPNAPSSPGWGELNSATLPSGASVSYAYKRDNQDSISWDLVLQNHPTTKSLTYQQQYDNTSSQAVEMWTYSLTFPRKDSVSTSTSVTAPNGGTTTDDINFSSTVPPQFDHGLSYRTTYPDGTVVERTWAANMPYGHYWALAGNAYLKREFTSIKDTGGSLSRTSIKDYDYDKNGNLTRVSEYDWVAYASVPRDTSGRPSGIPSGILPKRVTLKTYYAPTQNASDTNLVNSPNSYSRATSPALRNAVETAEISGDVGGTFTREEFYYDSPSTTGNMVEHRAWDSTKAALSRPLTAANWARVLNQYGSHGNLTLATDGLGQQTQYFYGPVGVFSDLYATQVKNAYGTSVQLTTNYEYDIYTGLTTRTTDVDNNVSTSTVYDPFGRPTLVVAAENKPEETRTSTSYDDVARRVVVRSDLNAVGDGKLVTVSHYDQLWRVRLTRRLEDASTQGETDETAGIKVQTRYAYGNPASDPYSYTLVSNPYRAAYSTAAGSELTMGWSRTKVDSAGKLVETQAFGGSSLPAPWGSNSASAGRVLTSYDAEYTTVTDQAGRPRRNLEDGLGRLVRVDEPDNSFNLGLKTSPVQPTYYTYDALGNLRKVDQGGQLRFFMYDSLSRLIRAKNPEQGTFTPDPPEGPDFPPMTDSTSGTSNSQWSAAYKYDDNGNLLKRKDARNVITTYGYDALNRNTSISYSDTTMGVGRAYDQTANGRGRLSWEWTCRNSSDCGSLSSYSYDKLGRVAVKNQQFWASGNWGQAYTTSYAYNRAGAVTGMTYPSGRTVSYGYDAAGRVSSFAGNLGDGVQRTYAAGLIYSAMGGIQEEQFGTQTPLYHKMHYNVRGQLYDVRLSTVSFAADQWAWNRGALINFYSTPDYSATDTTRALSGNDNNGNVRRSYHFVPLEAAGAYGSSGNGSYAYYYDDYGYDSLNRITSDTETAGTSTGSASTPFQQSYTYDRWGNRTINAGQTWGVASTQFELSPATNQEVAEPSNRLYALGDSARAPSQKLMRYDAAGNLVYDSYTGHGTRIYDAENRMTQAQDTLQNWATYTYDADGQRVKRLSAGQETWQVYGIGGELLAEYRGGSTPMTATKEYGYRGGELLVTMSSGDDQRLKRFVTNLYYGALRRDPTPQELQDTSNQLAAADAQSKSQLLGTAKQVARALFTQTSYEMQSPARTDPQYVSDLYYAYMQRAPDDSGLGWWVSQLSKGRSGVCDDFQNSIEFDALVTTLYGNAASDDERTDHFINNLYLGAYGTFATPAQLQQRRDQLNAAAAQGQDSVQSQAEAIGREVFAAQVTDLSIPAQQFVTNLYEGFLQRGPDAGGLSFWTAQAGTTAAARQAVLSSFATCPPARELAGALYRETFWLVGDHLGTPRMVVDKSGSLAGIKRHDYLPFGEEVFANTGGRLPAQGYSVADNLRQKFTKKERDAETNLDFFEARYYSSAQGRFTSPDEFTGGPDELYYFVDEASTNPTFYADLSTPQSLNKFQYAYNNPLRYIDPDGHSTDDPQNPIPLPPPPVALPPPAVPYPGAPNMPPPPSPSEIWWKIDEKLLEPWREQGPVLIIRQLIGTSPVPEVAPDDVPPPPMPQAGTPPQQQVQPGAAVTPQQHARPIDDPNDQGHKSNKRHHDKHTRVRPGQKQPPNYRPFRRPPPKPKPGPEPPKPKPDQKPEIGPDGQPLRPPAR
jgi:RHS repeat-associated protein